ncbi:MAG: hypothetical protein ACP5RT_02925 [Candidatus Micrarchaeia archaeon]
MKYARSAIKNYWVFEHKKALGLSLLVFTVSYSIGLAFFLITNFFFIPNLFTELAVALILFLLASIVAIGGFVNAHIKVSRLMNAKEHKAHSRNVGIFALLFFVGFIICLLPIILYSEIWELLLLLTIGGVLMLLFVAIFFVFGYKYYELAFASMLLWAVFVASELLIAPIFFSNKLLFYTFSLLIASIAILAVIGISGIVLLQSSTDEILKILPERNALFHKTKKIHF